MNNNDNRTDQNTGSAAAESARRDRARLMFTLAIVLIICGGNGIGLLAGGLLWKYTGQVMPAVGMMIAITAAAFTAAMLMLILRAKKAQANKARAADYTP